MIATREALRVLVVDDHPVIREGLRIMLTSDPGIQIIGEASSGREAVEKAERLEPDVVLTDIRMPGMSGIEVTRQIKAARPAIAVIVLTMYDSEMYVVEALRAGAAGYLGKDCSRELICHAVKGVVDGSTMVRSRLLQRAIQGMARVPQHFTEQQVEWAAPEHLTSRELEVLRLVAQGETNRCIAERLSLAEVTVKKHVQHIMGKLGVPDRTRAAMMAARLGLVE